MKIKSVFFLGFIALLASCTNETKLPILGHRSTEEKMVNGKMVVDTIYESIPPFSFLNQDSLVITNANLKGKIVVADFFFISCPTICPIMKKEMIRVYEAYKGNPEVMLISHTIDPEHDTLALLKDFSKRLGSDGKQWMFLTGDREKIYELAEKGYYSTAMADSLEPGGFVHSGGFILLDKNQHTRGVYNGTEPKEVDQLISDMKLLLKEK